VKYEASQFFNITNSTLGMVGQREDEEMKDQSQSGGFEQETLETVT